MIPVEKCWMAAEEFQCSGLSAREFVQLNGGALQHVLELAAWTGHDSKRRRNGETHALVVEVCVDAGRAGFASLPSALQIGLPGGARLVITDAAQGVLAAQC
jgi:hypothetical protein